MNRVDFQIVREAEHGVTGNVEQPSKAVHIKFVSDSLGRLSYNVPRS
jgi:hypothetical protein